MLHVAVDDLYLHLLVELYEVSAVTCNADEQLSVSFRMLVSIDEGLLGNNVELYLLTAVLEVGGDQGCELFLVSAEKIQYN